jgi:hypothetical protein
MLARTTAIPSIGAHSSGDFRPELIPVTTALGFEGAPCFCFAAASISNRTTATAPVSKEMAVRSLTRFVTVRAGNRFLLRSLRTNRKSEQANAEKKEKQEPTLSTAQATHLLTAHDDWSGVPMTKLLVC